MAAPESILKLCETFELHKDHYKSGGYNETELRREFLDPFFKALGWDVDNEQGYADAYKDVIHEDAIKVGGLTKAPDYCFRIGGTRKFFVEAKKPSVNIHGDIAPAYQLRRYGWSAKLPLCILSDFEELAVYDTRIKPVKNDKSAKARTLYFTYDQYAERWDEIAAIFSREALLKGSFDKYADTSKKKRGTGAVDDAFLAEIEQWRDALARNLALRNPALSIRDLNYAVQKTIDRLIFLRICEDRGTEDYGRLQTLLNGGRTYTRLMEFFKQADDRYNSGLFHFDNGEKGRSDAPDTLTPDLNLDDKVLKDILKNLYYPDSPYEFSVLPADILGQVYEQFLGKTISLTAGHQAKIEEKPEVRKAGGVYYTPSYIVDYIVKNTLGRLLDGDDPDNPKPIAVSKAADIKVLDPACGSGSFLIVAYQYLLDWHLRQYTVDPATGELEDGKVTRHAGGKNPKVYQASGGIWRLTTAERKRILLNNIHGVDIDSQAVEVTKLSLLLKVLEGETQQKLQRDFIRERQRILPDLGSNIKCGNSLIGPDFYDNEQMLLLDEETQYRINVFDWNDGFPGIMQRGGFDCVIGNPPYIPPELLSDAEKEYFRSKHSELTRKYDTSVVFILSMLQLLNQSGLLSYISSITWQTGKNYAEVRKKLFTKYGLVSLVNLPFDIFSDAYVDTCVYVISKQRRSFYEIYNYSKKAKLSSLQETPMEAIETSLIDTNGWRLALYANAEIILRKMKEIHGFTLGDITESTQGLAGNRFAPLAEKAFDGKLPFLIKGQAHRYSLKMENVGYVDMSDKETLRKFYLDAPKVLIRRVISRQDRLLATYHFPALVTKKDINPFVFESEQVAKYTLGILNSSLVSWVYMRTSSIATKDDFRQTTLAELRDIPIRPIDFDNPDDVAMHDKMVSLVERMLELNKKKADEKNPNILKQLETQIAATDRQIDQLVYKLYDLTEEEIALVEGCSSE
jgi:hypothetical protein